MKTWSYQTKLLQDLQDVCRTSTLNWEHLRQQTHHWQNTHEIPMHCCCDARGYFKGEDNHHQDDVLNTNKQNPCHKEHLIHFHLKSSALMTLPWNLSYSFCFFLLHLLVCQNEKLGKEARMASHTNFQLNYLFIYCS